MPHFRLATALLAAILLLPRALAAQPAQARVQAPAKATAATDEQKKAQAKEVMRKARRAFEDEDRALAAKLYLQALELDPDASEPYYRLGALADAAEEALSWFKQYAELEPGDAWGWLAVSRKSIKLGRTREALAAARTAFALASSAEDIRDALERARTAAAPSAEPLAGYATDSDGFQTTRFGLEGLAAVLGGFRLGARVLQSSIKGGPRRGTVDEFLVRMEGRPREALRLSLTAGLARTSTRENGTAGKSVTDPANTAEADLRVRWRAPGGGPALDLRLQRLPLVSNPTLVANQAAQNDGRFGIDVPVGPFRIRGMGRASLIETAAEPSNRRLQADAALVLPLSGGSEASVQFHTLGFERATSAGYFAPRSVQTIEAGAFLELGGEGAVTAELDLGLGIQRLAKQNEDLGPWKIALRSWGWVAVDITAALQARLEVEAYSAPFAPAAAVVSENWKYLSVGLGLLVRLR